MFNPNVVVKNIVNQPNTDAVLALIARVLMAYIFLVAGQGKISAYSVTLGYTESMGAWSAITAFIFHDGAQASINFMKNFAMVGGLFFLMLHGAGKMSLDHLIEK